MNSIESINLTAPPDWESYTAETLKEVYGADVALIDRTDTWYSEREIKVNDQTFFLIHDRDQLFSQIFDSEKQYINSDNTGTFCDGNETYKLIAKWLGCIECDPGLETEDYGPYPYGLSGKN